MTALILLYFIIILSFTFLKAKFLDHAFFNFFKSLFPSWKFFDESTDTPVLLYRFLSSEDDWKIAVPVPKRKWSDFFWNPEGNFYLAYHSHMQQLMNDLTNLEEEKLQDFQHHLSYKLTANFLKIRDFSRPYQFKISTIVKTEESFEILEDIILSPEIHS